MKDLTEKMYIFEGLIGGLPEIISVRLKWARGDSGAGMVKGMRQEYGHKG